MRRVIKSLLVVGLLLGITVFLALGATWRGYWGGWKGLDPAMPHYEGTEEDDPGKWEGPFVCYEFVDTDTHAWTTEEKAVARAAISEWDGKGFYITRSLRVLESIDPQCEVGVNIEIRWESGTTFFQSWGDLSGDGLPLNASGAVGFYVPLQIAPSFKEEPFRLDPCPDLLAKGFDRCSVILLNWENPHSWFIDLTPESAEEFELQTVRLCGRETQMLKAKEGGPVAGKQDLYTVVKHEFGHALGLIHSGGCDQSLLTGGREDDDGSVMWEGFLRDRRDLEDMLVGLEERRHLTERDIAALQILYPRDP